MGRLAELLLAHPRRTLLAFGVVAVLLALGALMSVATNVISPTNPLVQFVYNVDTWFQGPFSRDGGVFSFTGNNAGKLDALVNWGVASLAYSLCGSILRSVLRPRGAAWELLKEEAQGAGRRAKRRTVLR